MEALAGLFAYLQANPANTLLAVTVATVGNTAGGMTSYLIGRFIPPKKLDPRAMGYLKRYGASRATWWWPSLRRFNRSVRKLAPRQIGRAMIFATVRR
jgi:membrane protein YqaA with SNARE-associated domain